MKTTNPLEAILTEDRLFETYGPQAGETVDAELVDPNESEPEPTQNFQGLLPNQQAAITRANIAINALVDAGLFEWWLEHKLFNDMVLTKQVKEVLYTKGV